MQNKAINISNKNVAYGCAKLAVAAVFAYPLVVMLYAIIRSSVTICNSMPSGERNNILLQNGFSIAYSVAVFSILMAFISSIAGAIAGVILIKAFQYFNPYCIYRKAIVISCATAFAALSILYLLLHTLLKNWMTLNNPETFTFWFLVPAAFFLSVCITGGSKLNTMLKKELL
jgi:hypothetical protein